jgi:hypothetical protein
MRLILDELATLRAPAYNLPMPRADPSRAFARC